MATLAQDAPVVAPPGQTLAAEQPNTVSQPVSTEQLDNSTYVHTAGSFRRGLRAGANSVGTMLNSLAGQTGVELGLTEFAKDRFAAAEDYAAKADAIGPEVRDIAQIKDFTSLVNFVTGMAGQGLATSAPAIGLALGLRRPVMGIMAGAAPLEMGEQARTLRADPNVNPKDITGNMIAKGLINAGIDATFGAERLVANRILNPRKAMGSVAQTTGKGIVQEGITEGVQNVVGQSLHQVANPQKELDWHEVLNDAAAGASGGGALGLAGGIAGALPQAGLSAAKTAQEFKQKLQGRMAPPSQDDVPEGITADSTVEEIVDKLKTVDDDVESFVKNVWEKVKTHPAAEKFKDLATNPEARAKFEEDIREAYNKHEIRPKIDDAIKQATDLFEKGKAKVREFAQKAYEEETKTGKSSLMTNRDKYFEILGRDVLAGAKIKAPQTKEVADFLSQNKYKETSPGQWEPTGKFSEMRNLRGDPEIDTHEFMIEKMDQKTRKGASPEQLLALSKMIVSMAQEPGAVRHGGIAHALEKKLGENFEEILNFAIDQVHSTPESQTFAKEAVGPAFKKKAAGDKHRLQKIQGILSTFAQDSYKADPQFLRVVRDVFAPRVLDALNTVPRQEGLGITAKDEGARDAARLEGFDQKLMSDLEELTGEKFGVVKDLLDAVRHGEQPEPEAPTSKYEVRFDEESGERVVVEKDPAKPESELDPYMDPRLGVPFQAATKEELQEAREEMETIRESYGRKNVRISLVPSDEGEYMYTFELDPADQTGLDQGALYRVHEQQKKAGLENAVITIRKWRTAPTEKQRAGEADMPKIDPNAISLPRLTAEMMRTEPANPREQEHITAYVADMFARGLAALFNSDLFVGIQTDIPTDADGNMIFPDDMPVGKLGEDMYYYKDIKKHRMTRMELRGVTKEDVLAHKKLIEEEIQKAQTQPLTPEELIKKASERAAQESWEKEMGRTLSDNWERAELKLQGKSAEPLLARKTTKVDRAVEAEVEENAALRAGKMRALAEKLRKHGDASSIRKAVRLEKQADALEEDTEQVPFRRVRTTPNMGRVEPFEQGVNHPETLASQEREYDEATGRQFDEFGAPLDRGPVGGAVNRDIADKGLAEPQYFDASKLEWKESTLAETYGKQNKRITSKNKIWTAVGPNDSGMYVEEVIGGYAVVVEKEFFGHTDTLEEAKAKAIHWAKTKAQRNTRPGIKAESLKPTEADERKPLPPIDPLRPQNKLESPATPDPKAKPRTAKDLERARFAAEERFRKETGRPHGIKPDKAKFVPQEQPQPGPDPLESPLLDKLNEVLENWKKNKASTFSLKDETIRGVVKGMKADIGASDVGGRTLFDETTRDTVPGAGDVIGRTVWTGHEWWFRRPDPSVSAEHARRIIDKALEGKKLGVREQRFIDYVTEVAGRNIAGEDPQTKFSKMENKKDKAKYFSDFKTDAELEKYLEERNIQVSKDVLGRARALSGYTVWPARLSVEEAIKAVGGKFSAMNTGRGEAFIDPQEETEIRDYLKKVLGGIGSNLDLDKLFVDMEKAGSFANIGGAETFKIALKAIDKKGTAYHEAVHALFERLMKADKKAAHILMRAAQSPTILAKLNQLLKDHPEAREQLKEPEEAAAYMYQFWASGEKGLLNIGPNTKTWFDKVKNFFGKIAAIWADDMAANMDADDAGAILDAFHNGRFANPNTVAEVLTDLGLTNRARAKADAIWPGLGRFVDKAIWTAGGAVRDMGYASLTKVMDEMLPTVDSEGKEPGFLQMKYVMANRFTNRVVAVLKDMNEEQKRIVLNELRKGNREFSAATRAIGDVLDDLHDYMDKAGVKTFARDEKGEVKYTKGENSIPVYEDLRKLENYFPRVPDLDYLKDHKDEFMALLKKYNVKSPDAVYAAYTTDPNSSKPPQEEMYIGLTYFTPQTNERTLWMIPDAELAPFLNKDLFGTLSQYIVRAARRAEYTKRFGNVGENIRAAKRVALEQGMTNNQAKTFDESVLAMEGSLSHDMSPQLKAVFGGLTTYQNIRLLPLALFSSLVDPLGIAVRGGSLTEASRAFFRGIRELVKNYDDDATRIAELVGSISAAGDMAVLSDMYGSQYMPKIQQKINDAFFKYNGMESWNRSMRIAATQAAISFIKKHYESPNEHSERYFRELGLTRDDVKIEPYAEVHTRDGKVVKTGGLSLDNEAVKTAINRWVDQAILRPNASMRPIYMSDPMWMLVSHLKQYTYLFQQTILKRVYHEYKNGNYSPAYTLAMYVPMIIAADMARIALTPGGGDDDARKNWGAKEWLWRGVQRAGFFGPGQMALDAGSDMAYDKIGVESILGPTGQQFLDVAQAAAKGRGLGREAVKAIPGSIFVR
jgi:hypothetical protein